MLSRPLPPHVRNDLPLLRVGFLGVDLFFALSGFVLVHVCREELRTITWGGYVRFLQARVARIYPLHLVSLLLVLLVVGLVSGFAERYPWPERWSAENFAASRLVQNWGYFFPASWNVPAWSLSAEWGGYLVFPAVLLLL